MTLEFRFIVHTKAVLGQFLGLRSGAKRFGFRLCVLHHATATAVTCSDCAHATQFNCCCIPRDGLANVMNVLLSCACGSQQFNAGSAASVPSFLCKTRNRNVSRQQKPCCARSPKCSLLTRAAALCEREWQTLVILFERA